VPGEILLLDHLNINHQKGRHDILRAFYFDVLGLAIDPRKTENLEKERKTLWANAGITQFHLPEAESPQVFDGVVTIAFPDQPSLEGIVDRMKSPPAVLSDTHFGWKEVDGGKVVVTDPWGTQFHLVNDAGREYCVSER